MHKALRSLAKRLPYKVTKFEDAKDFQRMNLEELMGSIRRFGMNLDEENNIKNNKGIAFHVEGHKAIVDEDAIEDEDLEESFVLLLKNFNRMIKRLDGKKRAGNIGNNIPQNTENSGATQKNKAMA